MKFLDDKTVKVKNLVNFVKKNLDNGSGRTEILFNDLPLKNKKIIEKTFLGCERYSVVDGGSTVYIKKGKPIERYNLIVRREY